MHGEGSVDEADKRSDYIGLYSYNYNYESLWHTGALKSCDVPYSYRESRPHRWQPRAKDRVKHSLYTHACTLGYIKIRCSVCS